MGGTEWGGAMDDTMSGEAKALGVGAPPRDSGAFCHTAPPVLTYAGLRQHRSDLQHVRCAQCRRRGPRHPPRLQVTLHRRQTSSSLSGSNRTCWPRAATCPPASPTRGARRGRREPPATRTLGGARHRRRWWSGQRRLGRRSGNGRRHVRGGVGRAGPAGSPSRRRCRRGRGRCAVPGRMPARGAPAQPRLVVSAQAFAQVENSRVGNPFPRLSLNTVAERVCWRGQSELVAAGEAEGNAAPAHQGRD